MRVIPVAGSWTVDADTPGTRFDARMDFEQVRQQVASGAYTKQWAGGDVAVNSTGTTAYVTQPTHNTVSEIDLATGEVSDFTTSYDQPLAICCDGSDNVVFAWLNATTHVGGWASLTPGGIENWSLRYEYEHSTLGPQAHEHGVTHQMVYSPDDDLIYANGKIGPASSSEQPIRRVFCVGQDPSNFVQNQASARLLWDNELTHVSGGIMFLHGHNVLLNYDTKNGWRYASDPSTDVGAGASWSSISGDAPETRAGCVIGYDPHAEINDGAHWIATVEENNNRIEIGHITDNGAYTRDRRIELAGRTHDQMYLAPVENERTGGVPSGLNVPLPAIAWSMWMDTGSMFGMLRRGAKTAPSGRLAFG